MAAHDSFYILIINYSENDFQDIRSELQSRGFHIVCFHVESLAMMREAMAIREWDLFVAKGIGVEFCDSQVLALWKKAGKHIPFIVITDNITSDTALKLSDCGVSDVVATDSVNFFESLSLVSSMERCLQNHDDQATFREKAKLFDDSCLLLQEASFTFRTLPEAKKLADLFAMICPEPEKRVFGFRELFINAVEHGNLGITHDEKTQLNEHDMWDVEVERRLALPENSDKYVVVKVERTQDEIRFHIKDQGEGFAWEKYMNADPFLSYKSHGYGIAMAKNGSFDRIEYIGRGNEVVAVVTITSN